MCVPISTSRTPEGRGMLLPDVWGLIISVSDAIHKPRELCHWCCFFPHGLLSRTQMPFIPSSSCEQAGVPWGGRFKSTLAMFQKGPWKVLHLGNSPGGGSGSVQSGSPGLSLFSIFGTNWNVFRKVSGWCWLQPGPVPSPLAARARCSEFNEQGS